MFTKINFGNRKTTYINLNQVTAIDVTSDPDDKKSFIVVIQYNGRSQTIYSFDTLEDAEEYAEHILQRVNQLRF